MIPVTGFKRFFLIALFCIALAVPASARDMEDMPVAVVRMIDKMSARTSTFDLPVDKTIKFGNSLFIRLRACRKASPLDQPESAAFFQIWERKPAEEKARWIFSGWMFASNPALSALDHPVYDVWVIDCKKDSTSAKSPEFSSEAQPDGVPPVSGAPVADAPATDKPAADTPETPKDAAITDKAAPKSDKEEAPAPTPAKDAEDKGDAAAPAPAAPSADTPAPTVEEAPADKTPDDKEPDAEDSTPPAE